MGVAEARAEDDGDDDDGPSMEVDGGAVAGRDGTKEVTAEPYAYEI